MSGDSDTFAEKARFWRAISHLLLLTSVPSATDNKETNTIRMRYIIRLLLLLFLPPIPRARKPEIS